MSRVSHTLWFGLVLLSALWPGALAQETQDWVQPGGELERLLQRCQADLGGVRRFHDLPVSEAAIERIAAAEREWLARLRRVNFEALSAQGKLDYLLLRNHVQARLGRGERTLRRLELMDPLLPFRQTVLKLEEVRRRMEPLDAPAAATALSEIPAAVKAIRERVEQGRNAPAESAPATAPSSETAGSGEARPASAASTGPIRVPPALARRAADAADALARALREWFDYYNGYTPEFAWWLTKPHEEAQQAIGDYARYLRENIAGLHGGDDDPLIGDPIGADGLAIDLAEEMLAYSPQELIAIGERELAWCEAEMKKAAAEMGLGEDWKAALARVKERHVPPGEQDELVRDQAREAIAFLRQRDLITIPPLCEETWRIAMISPETQKVLPFAAYGGQAMLVAYPTSAMKHEDKLMSMRGNNRHFTRIVTPHELIPGHHLQSFMAERERPYRRWFSTPFFVEGWALYWEMTLWELPYAQGPEDRVGMLFWRMHRCARIIVSLKFHLGEMQPGEMVDFLVERVGHERYGATSEVRRYVGDGYSPLYQCGYMIGGLQLRALRREVVDAGKLPEKAFHDRLLIYGPIPIELIRAEMLGLPLARDAQAAWRFAEP